MSWVTKTTVFATVTVQREEVALQAIAGDGVDGRERLVHQHERWIGRKGARQPDALLLTSESSAG